MKCEYFNLDKCKSCNLLDKSYSDSLYLKENELKSLFPEHHQVLKPTVGVSGDVGGSRNKAKFAVFTLNSELTFGFYQSDGTTTELEHCPLHMAGINTLLPRIRDSLKKHKIIPYDLKSKRGELKYLLISTSGEGESAEFLLRFVLRSKESIHRLKQVAAELISFSPSIKVITANIQPVHQAILEGEEELILTSNAVIVHSLDEFKITLGARSFFQVTTKIALSLYNAVADAIKSDQPTSLIDLYCGVGVFAFYASRYCSDITGVEISKEAIDCAKQSTRLNNINANFIAMDVEKYLQEHTKKFDAVMINPPRRGLSTPIIDNIKTIAPRFIYYSSCNAKTLLRDYQEFKELYDIKSVQIFDMFPYTSHFETLMCLVRK